jgi:hypothetical protein
MNSLAGHAGLVIGPMSTEEPVEFFLAARLTRAERQERFLAKTTAPEHDGGKTACRGARQKYKNEAYGECIYRRTLSW